jgi:hypothetical protein
VGKKLAEQEEIAPAMKDHLYTLTPTRKSRGGSLLWTTLCLLSILLLNVVIHPLLTFLSFSADQPLSNTLPAQMLERPIANALPFVSDPTNHQQWRKLFTNIPATNRAPTLTITNYAEDRAIREAIFADGGQWDEDPRSHQWYFVASNRLYVYFKNPDPLLPVEEIQNQLAEQRERTALTARIVMGLWLCRSHDARFAACGSVAIRADEILQWRGVQKHRRRAYAGSQKRFSDGYQWKHKQQVMQDLQLLQYYYVQGEHTIIEQGKVRRLSVDSPYLHLISLQAFASEGETMPGGYLVRPGAWMDDYAAYNNVYVTELQRRIFQLHPQNDRLALRMALYLVEHWRFLARGQKYQTPFVMADLLAASMIPVDKTNLTSRFAPRVEAALQKLYEQGIVGEQPACLTPVDRTKAHWGADWLAASWCIVPPR